VKDSEPPDYDLGVFIDGKEKQLLKIMTLTYEGIFGQLCASDIQSSRNIETATRYPDKGIKKVYEPWNDKKDWKCYRIIDKVVRIYWTKHSDTLKQLKDDEKWMDDYIEYNWTLNRILKDHPQIEEELSSSGVLLNGTLGSGNREKLNGAFKCWRKRSAAIAKQKASISRQSSKSIESS